MTEDDQRFTVKEMLIDFRTEVRERFTNIERTLAETAKQKKVDDVVGRVEALELSDSAQSGPREIWRTVLLTGAAAVTSGTIAALIAGGKS